MLVQRVFRICELDVRQGSSTFHLLVGAHRSTCLCCVLFVFGHVAYRVLVPQPGMEPMPLAVEAWSANHWTTREFPWFFLTALLRINEHTIQAQLKCTILWLLEYLIYSLYTISITRVNFEHFYNLQSNSTPLNCYTSPQLPHPSSSR